MYAGTYVVAHMIRQQTDIHRRTQTWVYALSHVYVRGAKLRRNVFVHAYMCTMYRHTQACAHFHVFARRRGDCRCKNVCTPIQLYACAHTKKIKNQCPRRYITARKHMHVCARTCTSMSVNLHAHTLVVCTQVRARRCAHTQRMYAGTYVVAHMIRQQTDIHRRTQTWVYAPRCHMYMCAVRNCAVMSSCMHTCVITMYRYRHTQTCAHFHVLARCRRNC